ncbi:class I SAM-dependent methyltransferase [Vulgatibacter incomptus]|uniref:class I SAM-dependent methyltransferase n=1 Tax=Vulgatibacter incomptus TaxID=1391653 RepID=UPI00147068B3|nr:class I SAM-dependent methyltransferase [Vulgatibacter incomptus]
MTTPRRPPAADIQEAVAVAGALGLGFEPRNAGLDELASRCGASAVLVVSQRDRAIWLPDGTPAFRFHGGMAVLRIRRMIAGEIDPLVVACDLRPGDRVVDATAGACADALVLAHAVGPEGSVLALESSPFLHAVTSFGVRTRRFGEEAIDAALDRMEVAQGPHLELLASMPTASADVVYFDPMFKSATKAPPGFEVLRALADYTPLTAEALREARRVARRRLVVQDRRGSGELERLGIPEAPVMGRTAPVRFGVLEVGSG